MRDETYFIIHGFAGNRFDNYYLELLLNHMNKKVVNIQLNDYKKTSKEDWIFFFEKKFKNTIEQTDNKICIIAHSAGAFIAAYLALKYTQTISRIILVSPAVDDFSIFKSKNLLLRFRNILKMFITEKDANQFFSASPKGIYEFYSLLNKYKSYLFNITLPICFICGSEDKIIPIDISKNFFNKIKSSNKTFIEIPNANHWIFSKNSQINLNAINEIKNYLSIDYNNSKT